MLQTALKFKVACRVDHFVLSVGVEERKLVFNSKGGDHLGGMNVLYDINYYVPLC